MSDTKQVVITMRKEKETLRTWRYNEDIVIGDQPMIGKIYIKKTTLKEMGDPETMIVSLNGCYPGTVTSIKTGPDTITSMKKD